MTHTPAYHIIDGKRIIMPAHSITLYPPYSSIEYGSLENEIFCDDWLRFYTDEPFIVMVAYLLVPLLKQWITLI